MQTPTCGRIVHFFPISESDKPLANNSADRVPAMIVQTFGGNHLNLVVFPMNVDCPIVLRYSVNHKSDIRLDTEGKPQMSYWDWPEIIPGKVIPISDIKPMTDGTSGDLTYKQFSDEGPCRA